MSEHALIGLASILALGIGAAWLAWRIRVPSILMLLLAGLAAGPLTGLLHPDELLGDLLFPIVSISVAIILFEGGLSLRLDELGKIKGVVANLVSVGALLTWFMAGGAAYFLMGISLPAATLLGAILIVTGPTVIMPLLRHVQPAPRLASTLRWEGILIDPIGAVLAVLVFQALLAQGVQEATTLAVIGLLKTIEVGAVATAAGAGILLLLLVKDWVPDYLQSPLTLAVVVAAFAASNHFQPESGLLTATLIGVVLTNQKFVDVKHIIEFKENLGVLLISSLFILLAARLETSDLRSIGAPELVFLAFLIFFARPVVVWLCTIGSGFSWREKVFLSWVAPRGIVAAAVSSVFALSLAEAGYADARLVVAVTFMVIVGTVVVYGLTAAPLARLLGVARSNPQGMLILGAHPWALEIAKELQDEGVPIRVMDSNYSNIAAARMSGLPVHYGNALSEKALDAVDLTGIGRLIALTGNDEVNSLAALNFIEAFGEHEVYQLPPHGAGSGDGGGVARHLRGRFLFATGADYDGLSARFAAGADVKSTNITEEFNFESFKEAYPEAIPICLLDASGNVTLSTVKDPPEPRPGQRLLAIVDTHQ